MSKPGDKHYTEDEERYLYENYGKLSYEAMAKVLGRSTSSVYHKLRRMCGFDRKPRTGALNGNWKGGKSQLKSGYIRDNVRGRNVHSLVMEAAIGREIVQPEMVHHVDGDKSNNELWNLFLCKNASHHRQLHASLERVAFELVRTGVIKFDGTTGEYY